MKKEEKSKVLERVGKLKIVFVFLILCIILTILKPSFLTATNLINVLRQISIITIIAMGSTMIIISGGTIIGALIIGVLNNGLDLLNVSAYYQQIAKGLLIIAAVLMDQKSKRKA